MTTPTPQIETHPLEPFLPADAKVLILGSFPPKKERWSMDFFYPNFNNDMWRVMGLVFYGDKNHFIIPGKKKFDQPRIEAFCNEKGIAMFDTSSSVIRLKDNASDKFLQTVQATDINALLSRMPHCRAIIVTGEKAAETLAMQYNEGRAPKTGESIECNIGGRTVTVYRMPSTSRAYPLPLEEKAGHYRKTLLGKILTLLLCIPLLSGCNGFTGEEKALLKTGDGKIMRVLKVSSREDSLRLRKLSSDISRNCFRTEYFRLLAEALDNTVRDPKDPGVGIAAPQIGISRNVILVQRYDRDGEPFELMINPVIESFSGDTIYGPEGCLSVPGIYDTVPRYGQICVSYRDSCFRLRKDTVNGYTAIIIQHETDHLKGIIFTDRTASVKDSE